MEKLENSVLHKAHFFYGAPEKYPPTEEEAGRTKGLGRKRLTRPRAESLIGGGSLIDGCGSIDSGIIGGVFAPFVYEVTRKGSSGANCSQVDRGNGVAFCN
jgi:hypothetical protein